MLYSTLCTSRVSIAQIGMAMELNTFSAECMRKITRLHDLCGLAANVSLPSSNRMVIGQHDLAAASGRASSANCYVRYVCRGVMRGRVSQPWMLHYNYLVNI